MRSELGRLVLGDVLGSRRREKLRSEFGSGGHVALDLHLALHEGDLWVQSALGDLFEVGVGHGEGRVCVLGLALRHGALTVLQVDLIYELGLATLLLRDLESKDGLYLCR